MAIRYIAVSHFSKIFLLFFLFGLSINALAQGTISGRVTDSKSLEPLRSANVFISNTTIGATTDENGQFKLVHVPIGQSELVVSFIGYQSYQTKIKLVDGQQLAVNVQLVASRKILETVEVQEKRDKNWEQQLRKFNSAFLGTGKGASLCRIINPWVLDFSEDKGMLTAKASADLYIENKELGYTITYLLKKFESKGGDILILGNTHYTEMKSWEENSSSRWARNRWNAYEGSLQHFISAVVNHRIDGEGFLLYNDKKGFENSPRSAVFAKELGHSIEEFDTARIRIFRDIITQKFEIALDRKIEIHYPKGSTSLSLYEDFFAPVSWMELKNGPIKINPNGAVLNPENTTTSGYMSSLRVADMLPIDYKPEPIWRQAKEIKIGEQVISKDTLAEIFRRSYEKVYVHTDKPYYYPGERIWFKVYMNYNRPQVRDELSKTLYVELINPSKKIVIEKMLRLDDGFAFGDFILPDTLNDGNYYLRAYTQLQRNFGNEDLFIKTLPLLKLTSKPNYSNETQQTFSSGLKVTPDKTAYKTRDKITLTLELKDQEQNPLVGNFSVSVTDDSQVIAIPGLETIVEKFPIQSGEIGKVHELNYLLENGFALRGQFLNSRGKGAKAQLDIVQLTPYELSVVDTDEHGYFQFSGLQFHGETSMSITSASSKGKSGGQIKLFRHDSPPVIIKNPNYIIQTIDAQTAQRINSAYEDLGDSKMLRELVIKDKRSTETTTNSNSPYGADYVFEEKNIKTQFPNLLYTLQALNIAGLIVNPNEQTVYFARSAKPALSWGNTPMGTLATQQEIAKSYTPMVTLDGMPMMGPAGEVLMTIDPSTVGSIEVTKKQSTIRGSLAPYGVIAVYTKKGYLPTKQDPNNINFFKVQGYAVTSRFIHPDYPDPSAGQDIADYRSTLYWNPAVITSKVSGTSQISFYASDRQGSYRVIVEGIDVNGKPLRSVSFIEVKEQ